MLKTHVKAPTKLSVTKRPTTQTHKHLTKRTHLASKRAFCSDHHHDHSTDSNFPSLAHPAHVESWPDERKHRNDTFNALQAKYANSSTNSHQNSSARVLVKKHGLSSENLPLEPPAGAKKLKAMVKLGKGEYMIGEAFEEFCTPLSLLPPSLRLQHRQNQDISPEDIQDVMNIPHNIVVASVNGQLWDLQRPFDFNILRPPKKHPVNEEYDFEIEFHHSDSKIGQQVLWHSTAHVLGQALELEYQNYIPLLSDGPALPEGFFYDIYIHDKNGQPVMVDKGKMKKIAERMNKIIEQNQSFDRLVVTLNEARNVFRYNPFKLELIDRIESQHKQIMAEHDRNGTRCADMNGMVALYKCGSFVDLCRGPHIINTSQCGAADVFKNSASMLKQPLPYSYTPALGKVKPEDGSDVPIPTDIGSVQRVYGISFPTKKQLDDFNTQKARAEELDHRKLGKEQQLFMFHNFSPGSPFWLPHGTRIYNKLVNYLREEYRNRGYDEVRSPQVFDKTLWEISGHWENYKEDMFFVSKGKLSLEEQQILHNTHMEAGKNVPDQTPHPHHRLPSNQHPHHRLDSDVKAETAQQALKPMNCPGHCVLFKNSQSYSYRDLPVRLADFSNLHRNEASGALSGLTRVRCFAQDDAHIFAREDQLDEELHSTLKFIQDVYKTFDFPVYYKLSTRPESYIGNLNTWDNAEGILKNILNKMEVPWELNEGDGAFYGPKVDITVKDALGRYHQCATMQLDFNLPERFDLQYKGSDGEMHRPVMIHRAILGSLERFIAVLLEHTEGNWPLWVSPRQVLVTSVSPACQEYADYVAKTLTDQGIYADVANLNERIAKQVKMAQTLKYNYIVTVGAKEIEEGTVSIRPRGHRKEEPEPMKVDQFLNRLLQEINEKKL